uniref:J domain-containing protein n=1 Tax=Araucaria cunninghamii TaxID=56994 RepID=A0A0D6R7S8_ARACU
MGAYEMADTSLVQHVAEWIQQQKPTYLAMKKATLKAANYVGVMVVQNWPIIWSWLAYLGKLTLVASELWIDCSLRGIGSLLHLGSAACFVLLCCSVISTTAMSGIVSVLLSLGIARLAVAFLDFVPATSVIAILGATLLWMYNSFLIAGALIIIGGSLFTLNHARLAILITTAYFMYFAKVRIGWVGLLFCMNIAFISNDIFICLLESGVKETERKCFNEKAEETNEKAEETKSRARNVNDLPRGDTCNDQPSKSHKHRPLGESSQTINSAQACEESSTIRLAEADPSPGGEVLRILSSSDHYSTLGLSLYQKIEIVVLKREYRRKARLVHPDKNIGNAMAEESFKKLQIAYEVLSDLEKKNTYDEELRREELTKSFHQKIQSGDKKNGRYDSSECYSDKIDKEVTDNTREARRIACRKCNKTHRWIYTNRAKSRARWCQDCETYHQAKDGDGWMEYSGQVLFLGRSQKVDMRAYACIENIVYDVSDWAACQGLNCLPNTHNPSFHMDITVLGKNVVYGSNHTYKGTSHASRATNVDEYLMEEEFADLLHMVFTKFNSASGYQESAGMRSSYYVKKNLKRNGNKRW